jgi:putative MATE family efflux protein
MFSFDKNLNFYLLIILKLSYNIECRLNFKDNTGDAMTEKTKKPIKNETARRKILSMIGPVTGENLLQMAATAVTLIYVGRISPLIVGAVGISNIIFRIIWTFLKGLGIGASAHVAQSYGAGENHKILFLSKQGVLIALGFSIIFQQLIYHFTDTILLVFDPSSELLSNAVVFLKTISWSLPFSAVILMANGIFQGMGNAKTPMVATGILNVLNIVLGYVLIFGNLGFPELGLRGAGYAFTIGHIFGFAFIVYKLFKEMDQIVVENDKYYNIVKKDEIIQLLKYGIPTSFEMAFWQISSIFLTRAILNYGEVVYAAYQLGLQAEAISYMPALGISIASATFIGQSFGTKDLKKAKIYYKELFRITVIITAFTGGALILFPSTIMRVLTTDAETIKIGSLYLFIMGFTQLPQNLGFMFNGIFRGAGYPNIPVTISGIGVWLIRVPLALIISFILDWDIIYIWYVLALDLTARFIIAAILLKKMKIFDKFKIDKEKNKKIQGETK